MLAILYLPVVSVSRIKWRIDCILQEWGALTSAPVNCTKVPSTNAPKKRLLTYNLVQVCMYLLFCICCHCYSKEPLKRSAVVSRPVQSAWKFKKNGGAIFLPRNLSRHMARRCALFGIIIMTISQLEVYWLLGSIDYSKQIIYRGVLWLLVVPYMHGYNKLWAWYSITSIWHLHSNDIRPICNTFN